MEDLELSIPAKLDDPPAGATLAAFYSGVMGKCTELMKHKLYS